MLIKPMWEVIKKFIEDIEAKDNPKNVWRASIMKVAIYARVSLDEKFDDKRFQNVDNQLIPLRDFCKAMKYEIVAEYVDKMSGANPARPVV